MLCCKIKCTRTAAVLNRHPVVVSYISYVPWSRKSAKNTREHPDINKKRQFLDKKYNQLHGERYNGHCLPNSLYYLLQVLLMSAPGTNVEQGNERCPFASIPATCTLLLVSIALLSIDDVRARYEISHINY